MPVWCGGRGARWRCGHAKFIGASPQLPQLPFPKETSFVLRARTHKIRLRWEFFSEFPEVFSLIFITETRARVRLTRAAHEKRTFPLIRTRARAALPDDVSLVPYRVTDSHARASFFSHCFLEHVIYTGLRRRCRLLSRCYLSRLPRPEHDRYHKSVLT